MIHKQLFVIPIISNDFQQKNIQSKSLFTKYLPKFRLYNNKMRISQNQDQEQDMDNSVSHSSIEHDSTRQPYGNVVRYNSTSNIISILFCILGLICFVVCVVVFYQCVVNGKGMTDQDSVFNKNNEEQQLKDVHKQVDQSAQNKQKDNQLSSLKLVMQRPVNKLDISSPQLQTGQPQHDIQQLHKKIQIFYSQITSKIKIRKLHKQNAQVTIIINLDTKHNNNSESAFGENVKYLVQFVNKYQENVVQVIWVGDCQSACQMVFKVMVGVVDEYEQPIDGSYEWLNKHISKFTTKIIYTHLYTDITNHKITKQTPSSIPFLPILHKSCPSSQKKECIYEFHPWYLKIITPYNLQYQNIYTIDQLILVPVLGIAKIINIYGIERVYDEYVRQVDGEGYWQSNIGRKYELGELKNQMELCFVVFTSYLTVIDDDQILDYLRLFANYKLQKNYRINIIIILPLANNKDISTKLQQIVQILSTNLTNISIRLKLRPLKVHPPLQIYEISRWYSHSNSIIISHRLSTLPNIDNIIKQVSQNQGQPMCKNLNQGSLMLIGGYVDLKQKQHKIMGQIKIEGKRLDYDHYYWNNFRYGQIFCAKIMREFRLSTVKWQQTEFYSTQYAYVMPILQRSFQKLRTTHLSLFTMINDPPISQNQLIQIKSLQLHSPTITNRKISSTPSTIPYNQLSNIGYKRNPIQIIPRIIHQIWLSNSSQISPIKKALMMSVRQSNPQFVYRLWTLQDINEQNFPKTIQGIKKYMKLEEKFKKNYRALIADLMRIQILYKYGGIYLDMKVQGRKSLLSFLKFQQFYFTASSQGLVNGVIGSMKQHPKFKIILQKYFVPEKLNIPQNHIYDQTGGTVLVKAYSHKEIYTRILDLLQFVGGDQRPCIYNNLGKQPQVGQQVFQGQTSKQKKYRIFIPCLQDEIKYMQLYNVLGRTYFPNAPPYS